MEKVIVIGAERPKGKCELCGKEAQLRPYGPGGKNVCFECGMKNEGEAKRQVRKKMREGGDTVIL